GRQSAALRAKQTPRLKHNNRIGGRRTEGIAACLKDIGRAARKHDRVEIGDAKGVPTLTGISGKCRSALKRDAACVGSGQPLSCARKRDAATYRTRSTRLNRYYDWRCSAHG